MLVKELLCYTLTDIELYSRFNSLLDRVQLKPEESEVVQYCRQYYKSTGKMLTLLEVKAKFTWAKDLSMAIGKDFISNEVFAHVRDELLKDWIMQVADSAEKKDVDYSVIHSQLREMRDALEVGLVKKVSVYDMLSSVFERAESDMEKIIPSGIKSWDKALLGTVKGEITVIIAPPGWGKTLTLINLAYGALANRKNVLYLSLELNEERISQRLVQRISGTTREDLRRDKDKVVASVERFRKYTKATCDVVYRKPNTLTSADVEAIVDTISTKTHIDMLLVDYMDKLKVTGDYRRGLGNVVDDLRLMGERLEIDVVTVTQANRASLTSPLITEEHISESFKKVENADMVLSFCRSEKESKEGTGRIVVLKDREGRGRTLRGTILPVKVDLNKILLE